jgi:molecular chaperone IbpA
MNKITTSDVHDFLRRSTIGFDRFFSDLNANIDAQNYPPYNLVQTGENEYEIVLAVAGLTRDDLEVSIKDFRLTVSTAPMIQREKADWATLSADDQSKKDSSVSTYPQYHHRGIAFRNFERTFKLGDFVEVTDVTMVDGLLTIKLKREVPEPLKPKTFEIK